MVWTFGSLYGRASASINEGRTGAFTDTCLQRVSMISVQDKTCSSVLQSETTTFWDS